jgi:hypothetical protein
MVPPAQKTGEQSPKRAISPFVVATDNAGERMVETHAIPGPLHAFDYPGRQVDCVAALRSAVADLASTSQDSIVAAMGGEITDELLALAHKAEEAGWSFDEACDAIERLAREYEGAKGTIFD